jgi:hypothetical protein
VGFENERVVVHGCRRAGFCCVVADSRHEACVNVTCDVNLSHEPHPSEKRPLASDALTVKSARDTSPL